MKILLAVPYQDIEPYILPNLGLGYIASALKKKGHEVKYLDCLKEKADALSWRKIISEGRYDVVGVQMYSYAHDYVKNMLRIAKDVLPNAVTVVGGPHANAVPEQALRDNPEIDYVIHGEGEMAFPALLDALAQNDCDKASIPNLTWRDRGAVRVNNKSFIEDLDELDLPAWDLIDPRTYPALSHGLLNRAYPIAPIFATRGCPYSCTFCSARNNMGPKLRNRTPSKVVDEIEMLVKGYGVKEIHFEDDNFTFHKDFASQICQEIINRKIEISWACPNGVRLDSLDAELLKIMERAGCYSFALGIESGSDRVLKLMNKQTTVSQIRQKIRLIAETTRIRMTGFIIFGYPGESEADLRQTEELVLNEPLHRLSAGPFVPYPGTPVHEKLVKEKKLPEKYNWGLLASYGEDTFVDERIDRKRLLRAVRNIHLRFYLRPRVIRGILSEINSLEQLKIAFKMFLLWLGVIKIKRRSFI